MSVEARIKFNCSGDAIGLRLWGKGAKRKRPDAVLADGLVFDVPPASDLRFQHLTGVRNQLKKISFGPCANSVPNLYR
jgi:hypothetical protein